jgi:outer membrane protein assembly factor BamB
MMWVMGGYDGIGDSFLNDVWYSSDGVNWTRATAHAGWSAREGHTSVVFDDKMWVLGGWLGGWGHAGDKNDVWYSTDGVNWTQATASAAWSEREGHTSVVFDNRMWVIGGGYHWYSDYCYLHDVWYSTDGVSWTRATSSAGWSGRCGHTSVVFDNKMWVLGGNDTISGADRNDVWYSTDGASWTQATAQAGWSGRDGHTSVVFDNKMWVIGGYMNDVWYSRGLIATLITPNGGGAWAGGSNLTIEWRTVGTGFAQCRLLLSTDAGSTYPDTIAHGVPPTPSTYNWTVSSVNSLTCRVKVQVLDSSGTLVSQDPSDSDFEIDSRPPASVRDLQIVGRPIWSATLGWTAPGDDSMTGLASGYDIRYSLSPINDSSWQYANQCTGEPAPSTPGTWQTFAVTSLQVGQRYYFAMKARDNVYNWSLLSNVPSCSTSCPILASSQYPMFRCGLQHSGRSRHNGAQSSDLRWFYNTAQPIISSPVVAPDTTIYIVSENDSFYAITPNGTRRWSYYLGQGTQSVPAIASDSTICVGDGQGNLVVFPKNLSFPLWRYHTGGSILSSPAIGNDGVIYVGSNDGYLYAINPDSTLKWRHSIGSGVRSSPAISPDSTIYVGANDGKLYAISPGNAEKWNVAMPAALYSSPLVGPGGTVYVGCLNGKLYAVDNQGTVKWSFTTGDSIISSPAIDAGGRIFFGSCDHSVYAIEDSGSYAKSVWRYQTSGAVRSSPSISAQGTVYIGSDDGNIYAFRGSDSTVVWTRTTGSAVRSSPAIGANGTIYVGSDDGRLYAIGYASGIEEREAAARLDIPATDILCHGEPNPFVSRTTIRFGLSRAGRASLKVYSTAGAVVRTLVSEFRSPGYYTASWDGIDDRGRSVPAGIYVCRLQTAGIQTTTIVAKLK